MTKKQIIKKYGKMVWPSSKTTTRKPKYDVTITATGGKVFSRVNAPNISINKAMQLAKMVADEILIDSKTRVIFSSEKSITVKFKMVN